jgi:4'-phosphopantetheinyl transferase
MSKAVENCGIGHQLCLTENEIQVWCAKLDIGATGLTGLFAHLSGAEKERAARFSVAVERDRFVAARGILRELLGRYLQRAPASLSLETSLRGKPHLSRRSGELDARFNLSHSHGLALFAFCLGREVGIDIEKIRPEFMRDGIAEQYFSVQEREDLRAIPTELRPEAFFRCWTRKEAYLKARGDGLFVPLESFAVSLKPNEVAKLWSADSENWNLYSLETHAGFVGALVVEGPPCSVSYRECSLLGLS